MTLRRLSKRVADVDRVASACWAPRVPRSTLNWQLLTEGEQIALKHILRRIKAVSNQGLTDVELECTACLRERMDRTRTDPCDLSELDHA